MELPLCRPGVARYAASWRGATDCVVQAALVEIRRTCVENGPRPAPDRDAAPFLPAARSCSWGAVVVNNTHGSKKSFEHWSRNIIAAQPSVSALTDALRDGVKLSRDSKQRFANCGSDHIPRDWEPELDAVIERVLSAGVGRPCS